MLIIEGRKEDVYKKYQRQIDTERNYLAQHTLPNVDSPASFYDLLINDRFVNDETNNKYLDPLVNLYYKSYGTKDEFANEENEKVETSGFLQLLEIGEDLIEVIKLFNKYPNKFTFNDFNEYSKQDNVVQLLRDFNDVNEWAIEKETKKNARRNKTVIFENGEYKVIVPHTQDASCYYGIGTRWCVSAKNSNQFSSYKDRGDLFFILNKKLDKSNPNYKIAVYFNKERRTVSLWDATDLNIGNYRYSEFLLPNKITLIPLSVRQSIVDYIGELDEVNINPLEILLNSAESLRYSTIINSRRVRYSGLMRRQLIFDVTDNSGKTSTYYLYLKKVVYNESNGLTTVEYEVLRNQTKLLEGVMIIPDIQDFRHYTWRSKLEYIFTKILNKLPSPEYPVWRPKNMHSTYSFSKRSNLADKLTDYIIKQNENGEFATRNGFLVSIGKETNPGMLSTFFGSIRDAGIVEIVKGKKGEPSYYYKIGPNYKAYLTGKIRRL